MKIVADQHIPFVTDVFSLLGDVTLLPGREITAADVQDADVLLVRTVTPVNERMLRNSAVRFVGTATIGFDHVDIGYLQRKNIGFSHAAGCNANAVSEYVVAALFVLAARYDLHLSGMTLGIIGVGNVGSRVAKKARALGMNVLLNDPPRARQTGDSVYLPLNHVLRESDILTFHVPLDYLGQDATYHMGNMNLFTQLKDGAFVINTSRGGIINTTDLLQSLDRGKIQSAVIDVWEGEPFISTELLDRVAIGTPHIAGYSIDGKANATLMLCTAVCHYFGISYPNPTVCLPEPESASLSVPVDGRTVQTVLTDVIRRAYDIEMDDRLLRATVQMPLEERGVYFDHLRNTYRLRREFHSMMISTLGDDAAVARALHALGFQLKHEMKAQEIKE